MKKILLILITTILSVGCSSKLITLNEGISKDSSVTFGSIPPVEELLTTDEETIIIEELAGDKYIVTAAKGDKTEVQEFVVEFDTIEVDGTLPVDMNQLYSNPDKLAKVSYTISDDETLMTVSDENGEEPHSFNVPVDVIYPEYTIAEDITIDTYAGYDINGFVTAEEGVEITSELDEENSVLNITLSKNIWAKVESVSVTLISSEPQYPRKYIKFTQVDSAGYKYDWSGEKSYIIFDSPTTGRIGNPSNNAYGTFTCDNQFIYNNNTTLKYWFDGDYLNYTIVGGEIFGVYTGILAK